MQHGGYHDAQILEAIILLIASGGTCFSDWEILVSDPGFKKMFGCCMSVDVLKRCREILPKVKSWVVRSDSAGYTLETLDQWAFDGIIYYVTSDQLQRSGHGQETCFFDQPI